MGSGSSAGQPAYRDSRSARHHPRHRNERGLPASERLDQRIRPQRQASRDGLAAWRRIHQRQRQLHDLRRRESGPQARRRHGNHQPPAEFVRLPASGRDRRREIRAGVERRDAGRDRRAPMGPRQHREFRRRSEQRHHLRAIRRRRESQHAAGDARGQGLVPPRDYPERVEFAWRLRSRRHQTAQSR